MMKSLRFVVIVAGLAVLIGAAARSDAGSGPILILYAFDAEGELLQEKMAVSAQDTLLGRAVFAGTLSEKKILLVESGVGLTNAAMTTQLMIDTYDPRLVIFSGIAGALDSSVRIGDIVVSRKWYTHDFGYEGGKGFRPMTLDVYDPVQDSVISKWFFPVDSLLYRRAAAVAGEELTLMAVGDRAPRIILAEAAVSGNSFIDNHLVAVTFSEWQPRRPVQSLTTSRAAV